jgi:hypothetical protein
MAEQYTADRVPTRSSRAMKRRMHVILDLVGGNCFLCIALDAHTLARDTANALNCAADGQRRQTCCALQQQTTLLPHVWNGLARLAGCKKLCMQSGHAAVSAVRLPARNQHTLKRRLWCRVLAWLYNHGHVQASRHGHAHSNTHKPMKL